VNASDKEDEKEESESTWVRKSIEKALSFLYSEGKISFYGSKVKLYG